MGPEPSQQILQNQNPHVLLGLRHSHAGERCALEVVPDKPNEQGRNSDKHHGQHSEIYKIAYGGECVDAPPDHPILPV